MLLSQNKKILKSQIWAPRDWGVVQWENTPLLYRRPWGREDLRVQVRKLDKEEKQIRVGRQHQDWTWEVGHLVEHLLRTHDHITWVRWSTPVISALGWYRQKGQKSKVIFTHREFEISLGWVRHCPKENKHIKIEQQPIKLKEGTEKKYWDRKIIKTDIWHRKKIIFTNIRREIGSTTTAHIDTYRITKVPEAVVDLWWNGQMP